MNENVVIKIWKDVKGYEGLYKVSNYGEVLSLPRNGTLGGILGGGIKRGYRQVILCKNNKRKYMNVHKIVAEAFLPNPNNYPCINHKDENKLNNCIDNLEWCTFKYNTNYGDCINKRATSKKKPIYSIDKDGTINYYMSATDAANELGLKQNSISRCCLGIRKTYKGKVWKFEI